MFRAQRLTVTLLLSLTFATAASAAKPFRLDPSQAMTQYSLSSWRDTSGLPVDSTGSLAQTRDGYLWIGTEHGLVRFDGARFTVFNKTNTQAFKTNEVFTLFTDSRGTLWIGTRGGGAIKYDGRRFTRVPIKYRFVFGFAESRDGAVWIGAPSAAIRAKDGKYEAFTKDRGYPGGELLAMAAANDGVYIAFPNSVVRLDGRNARVLETATSMTALFWNGRELLAGDETGALHRLSGDRFVPMLRETAGARITSIIEGARGSLWISTAGAGILRWANGTLTRRGEADGLTTNSINQLLEDHEGNLWAGTTGGGLLQLKAARLTTVTPSRPLPAEWILPLLQARDGSTWFATNGGGVYHLDGRSMEHYTTAERLGANLVSALEEDSDGAIWVGTRASLQRIRNGRIDTIGKEQGLEGGVFGITAARKGGVWVGTTDGLYHVRGRVARKLTEKEGVKAGTVLSVRETADGALWISRPTCIEQLKNGKTTSYGIEQGFRSRTGSSLTIDEKDGSVWAPTMGDGLYRIVNGKVRVYKESDGLLSDSTYAVVQDRAGNLWVPTGRGLFSIKRADLAAFDAGTRSRIATSVYRKSDGLKSSDFSGGFDRPGFRATDGKLWFPTTRGLVIVDPAKLRTRLDAPRVVIEDVVANGVSYGPRPGDIDWTGRQRQLEFAYSAPAFYRPETLTFRFKLEGYDEQWHEAGNRRTGYYTNVPPGRYRFVVETITVDGHSSSAHTSFELPPRFYETVPFKTAAGLFLALVVMVLHRREVESVQKHQAALERSEEHFRSLIENAIDMILVLGRDGCITYASPSVQRVLGLRPYRVNAREFGDLVVDPASALRFIETVRENGHHSATLAFRDAMGNARDVEVIGAPCPDGEVILNCRDITDRRRLEVQLEQANRVASLGRLAATVSHEFNNVLMGIQPFVDLIRRKCDTPAVRDAVTQITHSVRRGKRISEEILRYTRPATPTLRPLAVRDWLTGLDTEIRALAGPNVRLAIIAPEKLTVDGDLAQLNQVLTNLVINARDAGATTIRIEAYPTTGDGVFPFGIVPEPQRFAHVTFTDNGCGIAAEVLPHIFEPLFTTKTKNGTGLGLAVAEQVISRHGGDLFAESKVGAGTTFHLFLPISVSASGELLTGDDEPEPVQAPSCRVLLVEDDSLVADGILLLLEDDGFTAQLAITGADALNAIPRFAPDVVVLDIGLPDISGIEVYRRIKSRWPSMRVVFSTGHGDMVVVREALPAPHPPCLQKPYGVEELSAAIAEAMSERARSVA